MANLIEKRISDRAKKRTFDVFSGVLQPTEDESLLLKEMFNTIKQEEGEDLGIAKVVTPRERGKAPLAQWLAPKKPSFDQPGKLETLAQNLFVSKKRFKELTTSQKSESGQQQALQLLFGHRPPETVEEVKTLEKVRDYVLTSKDKADFQSDVEEFMRKRQKALDKKKDEKVVIKTKKGETKTFNANDLI